MTRGVSLHWAKILRTRVRRDAGTVACTIPPGTIEYEYCTRNDSPADNVLCTYPRYLHAALHECSRLTGFFSTPACKRGSQNPCQVVLTSDRQVTGSIDRYNNVSLGIAEKAFNMKMHTCRSVITESFVCLFVCLLACSTLHCMQGFFFTPGEEGQKTPSHAFRHPLWSIRGTPELAVGTGGRNRYGSVGV